MQPGNPGGIHSQGNNYPPSTANQYGYNMEGPNYGVDSQNQMYQMPLGQTPQPTQNWNNQMMRNYPMMNPMFGNSPGVFGPYGYIAPAGPQNYKTKKCRHFETGRCKLAGLCNFAHGDEELRSANDK